MIPPKMRKKPHSGAGDGGQWKNDFPSRMMMSIQNWILLSEGKKECFKALSIIYLQRKNFEVNY